MNGRIVGMVEMAGVVEMVCGLMAMEVNRRDIKVLKEIEV